MVTRRSPPLHDEALPIETRFDAALERVDHLGKGILSAFCSSFIRRIWRMNRHQKAAQALGVWPDFDHGASPGKRYKVINDILHQLKTGWAWISGCSTHYSGLLLRTPTLPFRLQWGRCRNRC